MTDPKLTNEMKRHAVIVALKGYHRDLEIARFLRVARSFVLKIRKELEKENDSVMSVSKHEKKHSTRSDSMRISEFIHKVKQTIDENRGQLMRSIAKKVACAWKDNQKECSWKHSIQILRDEPGQLFQKNQKKTA